jgi:hypothetical protein
MKDPVLGFGQVSCLDLITHLRSMYGTITPEALDKNLLRMSSHGILLPPSKTYSNNYGPGEHLLSKEGM